MRWRLAIWLGGVGGAYGAYSFLQYLTAPLATRPPPDHLHPDHIHLDHIHPSLSRALGTCVAPFRLCNQAFIGLNSLLISIILPIAFYRRIHLHQMSGAQV